MIRTFSTRIYPTKEQRIYFHKAFGIRRFTWNWALNEYLECLRQGVRKTSFDLQKQLNNTLVKDSEYSWLSEVNSMVRQESLKDLGLSITKYHDEQRKARRTSEEIDTDKFKPKFKSKKRTVNSFRMNNKGNPVKFASKHFIYLTTVGGKNNRFKLKLAEPVGFLKEVKFCEVTIKELGGKYYIAISYEQKTNVQKVCKYPKKKVGIDMGIKNPLTTHNGKKSKKIHIPRSLRKQELKTERIQRILARKVKGSNNFKRIKQRLQRSYIRENNIKKDFREKLTTKLCSTYGTINIETFSHPHAKNLKNSRRVLSRVGLYIFVERLKEKAEDYHTILNFIPKGTPTTQTCSYCGHRYEGKEKLNLNTRTFVCVECGLELDRDINAAVNIYNYC